MSRTVLAVSVICAVTINGLAAYAGGYGRSPGPQGMPMPPPQGPGAYSYSYSVPSAKGTEPPTQVYGNGFTSSQGLSGYSYGATGGAQGTSSTAPKTPQGSSFSLSPSGAVSYSYTGPQGSTGYSYTPQPSTFPPPADQSGAYNRPPPMLRNPNTQQTTGYGQAWQQQNQYNAAAQYGVSPQINVSPSYNAPPQYNAQAGIGVPPPGNNILQTNSDILSGN